MQVTNGEREHTSGPVYTFHKHSRYKDIVYFRCADKNCMARLKFNVVAKEISMRNSHLNISSHRNCRAREGISIEELLARDDLPVNCSVVVRGMEIAGGALKRDRHVGLLKGRGGFCILKMYNENLGILHELSRALSQRGLLMRSGIYRTGREGCLEVSIEQVNVTKAVQVVNGFAGYRGEMVLLRSAKD